MSLPFNNSRSYNGVRQFSCFICGILQPDKKSFCEHIIKSHEESKDYIICPMAHCKIPVRCLRAHYRAIHSHTPCPQNCQLRAIVWRDPKNLEKKKKVSFKEGYHISPKNRHKLHYNSGWELTVYRILDKMEDVIGYEVEPLQIEYFFDGERKTYLPDLRVHFADGRKEVWEIKPANQTNLAVNESKWECAFDYCQKRGWLFKVITEIGIEKMKKMLKIIDID